VREGLSVVVNKTTRRKGLFLAGLLIVSAAVSAAQTSGETQSYGKKYTMRSNVLNETRTYWVNLPATYDDPRFSPERYPVMYVFDGKSAFFPLSGILNFMSGPESVNYQVPEMIIVGIDNDNRMKDLTPNATNKNIEGIESKEFADRMFAGSGGGERFIQFLEKELIPDIEANYRTLPYRVCIGHSLGGLMSSHLLVHHAGLFDAYIAIDPSLWWDGASMINNAPATLKNYPARKMQRYFVSVVESSAVPASLSFHIRSIHKFGSLLADDAPANLKWKLQVFPETDHSSIPMLSWYYGLRFLFEGYEPDLQAMMKDTDLVERHFKDLEAKLGLKMPPPESLFEILTHYLTAPDRFPDPKKALAVVTMGLKYHPNSPYLNKSLGLAYELNKEPEKAAQAYEKALKLDPKDETVKKKLAELKLHGLTSVGSNFRRLWSACPIRGIPET
jgi:predicted alpha/beta superfamily hydrolase